MKLAFLLLVLTSTLAFAGLPPTTSKGSGDSTFKTTFNYDFGSILLSHSGTTVTIGTIPASMLAIAASAPLTLTNGTFGIPVATAGANGYLSSSDFSTFNSKQAPINVTAPITLTSGTLVGIPVSTNSVDGYLSGADHTTFSNKLSSAVTSLMQGSGISLNPSTITGIGTISANVTATLPVLSTGSVVSLGTVGIANGGTGQSSAIAAGNFLMSNGSAYSAGTIAVGSNLLLTNSGNVFTVSHGTTSVAQGGTGLSSIIGAGNFLMNVGGVYAAGTLAVGSGMNMTNSSGVLTINNGTVAVSQGGTGLTSRVGTGQLVYDNGSAYTAGTIAGGTGISVGNSAGVYTITNTSLGTTPTVVTTGTDYVASFNTVILVNGGLKVTLPSASGNDGKFIRIRKIDSPFTTTGTIAQNAADQINFSASNSSVNTLGEDLTLIVSGTNWVGQRLIPSTITSMGTSVISAVTTAPGKGTVALDQVTLTRIGCEAELKYIFGKTALGSTGTGDYLYSFPSGIVADTTYTPVFTTTESKVQRASYIGSGEMYTDSGPSRAITYQYLYSTTQFRTFVYLLYSGAQPHSSTHYSFDQQIYLWLRIKIHVSGWKCD